MSTPTPTRFVIVAAIDGSPASADVAHTAARLTQTFAGGELHLLHAIDSSVEADRATLGETPIDRRPRHQKHLDHAVKLILDLGAPRPQEHLVEEGAKDAILDLAAELEADLILVGTHGRKGLNRLLMGSVAEAIVRSAHCPVLVVRDKSYPVLPAL
jgi:nucleotide-binding universal stress UspA family protein